MNDVAVEVRWVNGEPQLANSLTKDNELQQLMVFSSRNGRWKIVHDTDFISGRKGKSLGINPLSEYVAKPFSQEK